MTGHASTSRVATFRSGERFTSEPAQALEARECVACGDPCPPGRRWCSMRCFALEDGDPYDPDTLEVDDGEEPIQ